jgi:hypothetical protein
MSCADLSRRVASDGAAPASRADALGGAPPPAGGHYIAMFLRPQEACDFPHCGPDFHFMRRDDGGARAAPRAVARARWGCTRGGEAALYLWWPRGWGRLRAAAAAASRVDSPALVRPRCTAARSNFGSTHRSQHARPCRPSTLCMRATTRPPRPIPPGTWSQKAGEAAATDRDADGKKITDPEVRRAPTRSCCLACSGAEKPAACCQQRARLRSGVLLP